MEALQVTRIIIQLLLLFFNLFQTIFIKNYYNTKHINV